MHAASDGTKRRSRRANAVAPRTTSVTLAAPISNASPTCNMVRIVTETANETEKQRARLRGCRCLGERIGHVPGHCHNRGSARVRLARPVAAPTASVTQPTHSRPRDDAVCSAMCGDRPSNTTSQLVAALGEVAERLRRPVERQHYEEDRPVHRRATALQAQRRSLRRSARCPAPAGLPP